MVVKAENFVHGKTKHVNIEEDTKTTGDVPHSVIYDESSLVLDPLGLNIEQVDVDQDDAANNTLGGGRLDRYSDKEEERSTCAYNGATQIYMQQIQSQQLDPPSTRSHVSDASSLKEKLSLDSDSTKEWLQSRIRRSSSGSGRSERNSSVSGEGNGDDGSSTPNSIHKKNTCLLSITSDHLFTAQYRDASVVTGEIANFVSELNSIFEQLVFSDGTKGYGFAIAKITIEDESSLQRDDYKYKDPYIGVEKLLDLVSTEDHSEYCLAYLFTARDFMKGVLGLAWVAGDSASGGICESYKMHQNGQMKSLNTGVITTVNYGQPVAARVSHLTFTHEVGHNWGSPHDFPQDCKPGGQEGNFIMFASATSADKPNNNRFSDCSVANMSHILFKRRDECFKEAGRAICGNMVLDEGEECDCGFEPNCLASGDQCCHPAGTTPSSPTEAAAASGGTSLGCTLKPGLRCSPSQGPCCTAECQLVEMSERQLCQEATECVEASYCDGTSVSCTPVKKPNLTDCNGASQVCLDGVCAGSVCLKYDMEDCLCSGEDYLCDICCQKPSQPASCESSALLSEFGYNRRMKNIGSPCDDMNGYCDAFNRCMAIDSNGPLSRLRDAIFNPDVYRDIFAWAKAHWWLTVIICVASSILFILFVKVFSVHTPSSNPNLPKNRQIRDTVSTLPRSIRRSTAGGGGRSNSGGGGRSRSRAHLQYQSGQQYNHPPQPIIADSGPPEFLQPPIGAAPPSAVNAPPPASGSAGARGAPRSHSHDSRKDKRRRNGRNNRDSRREGGANGNGMDPRQPQSYDPSYPPQHRHHQQQPAAPFSLHSTTPGHQLPPNGGHNGTGHEALPMRDMMSPPPYSE